MHWSACGLYSRLTQRIGKMKKNLKGKIALIVAVLLVCLYGIFGVPSGVSGKALMEALTKRIHLGLDLQGRRAPDFAGGGVRGGERGDGQHRGAHSAGPEGRQPDVYRRSSSRIRNKPTIIRGRGHGAGQAERWRVRLLEIEVLQRVRREQRRERHLDADHEAALSSRLWRRRPCSRRSKRFATAWTTLGVSEPVIQEYGLGDNQILVELPGISDLDRVKTIIQSTARLEIHPVVGGPLPERAGGAGQRGRHVCRRIRRFVHGSGSVGERFGRAISVYVLQRDRGGGGQRLPFGRSRHEPRYGPARRSLHADQRGRRQVLRLHQRQRRQRTWRWCMGGRCAKWRTSSSAIRDQGEIEGSFSAGRSRRRFRSCCAPARCRLR